MSVAGCSPMANSPVPTAVKASIVGKCQARTVSIEEDAGGQLHKGVGEEERTRHRRQNRRLHRQVAGEIRGHDAEARAQEKIGEPQTIENGDDGEDADCRARFASVFDGADDRAGQAAATRKLRSAKPAFSALEAHAYDCTETLRPSRDPQLAPAHRIVVAPMHQYSAVEGMANDWHLVNAGKFAQGGAGLVIMESTKIARAGCGTVGRCGALGR